MLGTDEDTLSKEWHDATKRSFASVYETTKPATSFGRTLISRETGGGDINLTPALSPDGKRVVFLSERSLFSIDMFVADVATGKIGRRLVETTSDPHFDSLQFLSSAGDWAPDNRRFVFAALSGGQPVLTIVDVDRGRREAEHEFKDLGEIYNPAWSPDGRIAFSALKGGVLDLYVFDLDRQLEQLTNDPFADLDPEWTPDGRELVWVTDRFSSNLESLSFGNYRMRPRCPSTSRAAASGGLLAQDRAPRRDSRARSPGSRPAATPIPSSPPTARCFSSPRRTASPTYWQGRSGSATRVTNVVPGVSGITPLTPAMSAASNATALVFTVFENDHYNIYATDTSRPSTIGAIATDTMSAACCRRRTARPIPWRACSTRRPRVAATTHV